MGIKETTPIFGKQLHSLCLFDFIYMNVVNLLKSVYKIVSELPTTVEIGIGILLSKWESGEKEIRRALVKLALMNLSC